MNHRNLIGGVFFLLLGILLSAWSTSYRIGSMARPGPGFLPFGLGLLLVFLCLILLGTQLKRTSFTSQTVRVSFQPGGGAKTVYNLSLLVFATFLFERIGFTLTVFFLLFFLMLGADPGKWKKVIFISLFVTFGIYVIFIIMLKQPLPRGFFGI